MTHSKVHKLTPKAKVKALSLSDAIDALGLIKAQEAALADKSAPLKAVIAASGAGGKDGEFFHSNVSYQDRVSTDDEFKAKVKELMEKHTTPQWRAAHSSSSTSTVIKITARSAALVASGKAVRS